MTTNEQIVQENVNTLWETGFDDGWFFKGSTHPKVDKALDWLKKNHTKGQEFADLIRSINREINGAQMLLAEIDDDLTTVEEA